METSINRNAFKNWLVRGYLRYLKNTDFLVVMGMDRLVVGRLLSGMFKDSINLIHIQSNGFDLAGKLLKIKKDVDLVIIELDIDSEKGATNVISIVKPMMVVLTQLCDVGEISDNGSYQYLGVLKRIINGMKEGGVVIANYDDENCKLLVNKNGAGVFYYGIGKLDEGLWASNVKIDNFRTRFELNLGVERAEIYSNILGEHMVYPQLAAGAAAVYLGVPLTSIKNSLESANEFNKQMQVLPGIHSSIIIDDTKMISIASLEGALESLDRVSARKRILVSTGVEGLIDSEKVHQRVARKIFKQNLDYCFFLGREGKIISEELLNLGFAAEKMEDDLSAPQIVNKLIKLVGRGDVILIKGIDQNIDEIVYKLIKE